MRSSMGAEAQDVVEGRAGKTGLGMASDTGCEQSSLTLLTSCLPSNPSHTGKQEKLKD